MKTKSTATTIAFTNHERLLQHILEEKNSHLFTFDSMVVTYLVTLIAILAGLRFLIFDRCVAFGHLRIKILFIGSKVMKIR